MYLNRLVFIMRILLQILKILLQILFIWVLHIQLTFYEAISLIKYSKWWHL